MPSYIKQGQPLEYDNAPDWLVAFMRYRRTMLGNTPKSVMTFFLTLREFCQWVKAFCVDHVAPASAKELREIDVLDLPAEAVAALKKTDIESYVYYIADTLDNGPRTRNKKLTVISTLYDWLADQEENLGICVPGNPVSRIKRPHQPKTKPTYLTDTDQESLLEGIAGENAVRDYAIILTMLVTGIRLSELCNLDVQDTNLDAKTLRVRNGKGQKDRICYLTDAAVAAIRRYITEYRELIRELSSPALFVSYRQKKRLTARAVEKILQKQLLEAKLGGMGYTPHKLRHTTATNLAKDKVALLSIQQVLGHENPTTTSLYTHLSADDVAEAVRNSRLSDLGNES